MRKHLRETHLLADLAIGFVVLIHVAGLLGIGGTANAAVMGKRLPHIVFQCDRADEGIRSNCERFRIAAHPTVGEHSEKTATHRYEVETCTLYPSGNLNDCTVRFVAKGDQIIAR